jgi:hypothetical protein
MFYRSYISKSPSSLRILNTLRWTLYQGLSSYGFSPTVPTKLHQYLNTNLRFVRNAPLFFSMATAPIILKINSWSNTTAIAFNAFVKQLQDRFRRLLELLF